MIPQAELDRALARWKARNSGHEPATSGPPTIVPGETTEEVDTSAVPQAVPAHDDATPVPEASSASIQLGDFDLDGGDQR